MLRKLLKYEFLATGRQLLPAYAGVILFAVLSRISVEIGGGMDSFWQGIPEAPWIGVIFAIMMLFYVLSIFGVMALTVILIIRRFYTNLFKDEGYLTNTLPVSVDSLIWGKLIPAACWSVISGIVTILSFIIVFGGTFAAYGPDIDLGQYFWLDLLEAIPTFGLLVLNGIAALLAGILAFYSALSIGQLAKRHKILAAIGAYIGMSFVFSILFSTLGVGIGTQAAYGVFSTIGNEMSLIMLMYGIMLGVNVIQGAVHYVITRSIMKNSLNLE